jgi:hypothetical protein
MKTATESYLEKKYGLQKSNHVSGKSKAIFSNVMELLKSGRRSLYVVDFKDGASFNVMAKSISHALEILSLSGQSSGKKLAAIAYLNFIADNKDALIASVSDK